MPTPLIKLDKFQLSLKFKNHVLKPILYLLHSFHIHFCLWRLRGWERGFDIKAIRMKNMDKISSGRHDT